MVMTQTTFTITPALVILLRGSRQMPIGLHQLQVATAEQLCRPHYSMGSLKAVKAKLRVLEDHGFVQHDAIPTKLTRSPYYYTLDKLGVRYLQQAGMDINESFRSDKEVDKHSLFMEHTLELNDIVIAAALLKRSTSNYWLDSFIHERVLKRSPYKAVWQGGSFTLISDTFLDFRVRLPEGLRRVPVVVEHDRGTEEQTYFRRRIKAYILWLRTEGFKRMFQTKSITIAFTTSAGVERLKKMREWTVRELEDEPRSLMNAFYFTSLDKPLDPRHVWLEPCWYMPYEEGKQPIALLAEG